MLHFASPASPVDYLEFPIPTLKVGRHGTHNALGVAKAKGARFFLASTSEVYGDPLEHPQTEKYWGNVNPVGPRGCYDEAKRFAEAMTMAYHRYHGVDTRIVRIFNTYGPRMRPNDGRVVSNFIVQALTDQPHDDLRRRLADAQLLLRRRRGRRDLPAVHAGRQRTRRTSATRTSSRFVQLAELVIELTGTKARIVEQELPVDDPKVRRPDITRAREMLGWEPADPPPRRGDPDDRVLSSGPGEGSGSGPRVARGPLVIFRVCWPEG